MMNRLHYLTLAAIVLFSAAQQLSAQPSFQARKDTVRAFFASDQVGVDAYGSLARILDPATRGSGAALLRKSLGVASTHPIDRFRITAVYLFAGSMLPDSLSARIREIWSYAPVITLESEHQRVAYYSALLLAAEHFPASQTWYNGRTSAENRADALSYISNWMDKTTREGQQEFDSPAYGAHFVTAMLLLRQFAGDADLRAKADLMVTWLLADYFHEYIGGQFGGAHGRDELMSATQPITSELTALAWLYVGDGPQIYSREQFLASLTNYVLPDPVLHMAAGKTHAFEAVEVKRSDDRIRGDSIPTRPVIKYTYVDPLYVAGSIRGGLVQPREQRSWSFVWSSDVTSTTMFSLHPYAEPSAVAGFLPHSPEQAFHAITTLDQFYATATKTVGGSPYEDVFQHKNTVIALYNVPEKERFPLVLGYWPKETTAFEADSMRSGWITINAGDVYIAAFPLRHLQWYDGDAGRYSVSGAGRNGLVTFIVGRSEAGAYERFRDRVRAMKVDTTQFTSTGRIRFTTYDGTKLDCTWHGRMLVNGAPDGRTTEYLFSSPWMSSRRGTGVLMLTDGRKMLKLDMPAGRMSTADVPKTK